MVITYFPFAANLLNLVAPYFLRPINAARAPGLVAPLLANFFLSDLNRAPLPNFAFIAYHLYPRGFIAIMADCGEFVADLPAGFLAIRTELVLPGAFLAVL